jgi:quercetin dioxygenase-like cupin family protein
MNLNDAFFSLDNYFSPKIIGKVNDQFIKVVKIKGQEVPWHIHENEDELFYIIDGQLLMKMENQVEFTMKKGDLFVVKKETNHRVSLSRCNISSYTTTGWIPIAIGM